MVVLDLIEAAADRVEVLRVIFTAEAAKVPLSTRRGTEVAAEVRQLESGIAKMVAGLDPKAERETSARHVAAANARWHQPQQSQMETVHDGPL